MELGLGNGYILDSDISSSSVLNASTRAKNGRLNYNGGSSWCAATNDSKPYLQIEFERLYIICAVSTQGNSQGDQWVKTFTLQTSKDGTTWTDYQEAGRPKVRYHHNFVIAIEKHAVLSVVFYARILWLNIPGVLSIRTVQPVSLYFVK